MITGRFFVYAPAFSPQSPKLHPTYTATPITMDFHWSLIPQILYVIVLVVTVFRIIYDTDNSTKTVGYLLLVLLLPVVGIIVYYAVGVNLRKRKLYQKKLINDERLWEQVLHRINVSTEKLIESTSGLKNDRKLIRLLLATDHSRLTGDNEIEVLINGERKFPRALERMRTAKHHLHVEYYRFEDDEVGGWMEEVLKERAQAGVQVRLIYDDFGSRSIRGAMARRLRAAGVELIPFFKITFLALANRVNYRNHRKIIVIDGVEAFVGGINVSNDYVNTVGDPAKKTFWRDTHLWVRGSAAMQLQYIFLNDWNFASAEPIALDEDLSQYFPVEATRGDGDQLVQIAASGPDSDTPTILYSIIRAIALAERRILIATPYFVPTDSLMDGLCIAARSGVDVSLMVPLKGDSRIVNLGAESYYEQLLAAGVKIYRYEKGFIHAKTIVVDDRLSIVGTANLDIRSFELNFEVNAVVYGEATAARLTKSFECDLEVSRPMIKQRWEERPVSRKFAEKVARMLSPVL